MSVHNEIFFAPPEVIPQIVEDLRLILQNRYRVDVQERMSQHRINGHPNMLGLVVLRVQMLMETISFLEFHSLVLGKATQSQGGSGTDSG